MGMLKAPDRMSGRCPRVRGKVKGIVATVFGRILRMFLPERELSLPTEGCQDRHDAIIDYRDDRIPQQARERVRTILVRLAEVEQALRREAAPHLSAIDVAQMRDAHLPTLIRSYVDIPAAHRSEIFRRTGRSASFVLMESLDQMLRHLDVTLHDLARHDIDAFTTNIRFIAQKFSDGDDTFR